MHQIIGHDGEVQDASSVDLDDAARLYDLLCFARAYDRKGSALQKQGRLATYAPYEGQEAAQVGSASALDIDDWVVPSYREPVAMWMHGYPLELLLATRIGDERGGGPPPSVKVLPPCLTVGGHLPHAVGLAWSERCKATDRIALVYFGDGATSEGDFHEALNFAGVLRIGCIFLCQNNGWAISTPREAQTASDTIAQKAAAYGFPGVQVDGNDVLAVQQITREAVGRARRGDGPTLIEAVTYRMGPHTTADDPSRYRDDTQVQQWRERDPLDRMRRLLERNGRWTPEWQVELDDQHTSTIEAALSKAEAMPPLAADEIFEAMFAELPPHLQQQQMLARGC